MVHHGRVQTIVNMASGDVAAMRFAVSPLYEVVTSCRFAWRHQQGKDAGMLKPWLEKREHAALALSPALRQLVASWTYIPDFLTPQPSQYAPPFELELERLRSTPLSQIREEVRLIPTEWPGQETFLRSFLEDTGAALATLTAEIERYWEAIIAPDWARFRPLLEEDVLYRARQLAVGGAEELLRELHPRVSYGAPRNSLRPSPRGLTFIPSLFVWPHGYLVSSHDGPLAFAYPARGTAELWLPRPAPPRPLVALLGELRADLLMTLGEPRSTVGLSALLGYSASRLSPHLAHLHEIGLLTRIRQGKRVWYQRSEKGEALVAMF